MLDRGIGLIGVALAIIFGVWSLAPEGWPKMPPWASFSGIGAGILLVGVAVGLIIGDFRQQAKERFVDTATLRLHIYPDDRTPQRLFAADIWRYYYMRQILVGIEKDTGKEIRQDIFCSLFVSFDTPVKVGTLEVSSPDIRLPSFEVKEFNNRYAIIYFSSPIPEGTLEINVHP